MVEDDWRKVQRKISFTSKEADVLPIVGILIANSLLKLLMYT